MTLFPQNTIPDHAIQLADLLLGIARSLVDQPEALKIETSQDESGTTLRLYVSPADLGKVIGKQGRTARSLRTILSAIGSRSNHRYTLDIVELP